MADYAHGQCDIEIVDPSTGDTIPFVCVREGNKPAYRELDSDSLVDLFSSEAPTQYSTNPQKELPLGQTSFHAGLGSEYQDTDKPHEYHKSTGCDLRHKGMGILSWASSIISSSANITGTAAVIANTDMEALGTWTNGARDNTQAHAGTYSWNVNDTIAYQDASNWTNAWRSKLFTFDSWAWAGAASDTAQVRIAISDGAGTTYSSFVAASGAWEHLIVSRTLDAAAGTLRVTLCSTAGSDINYFDDCRLSSPTGGGNRAYCHATFNDLEYVAFGSLLVKLNGTYNGWTSVLSLPANITCLEPFQVSGVDYLMIALGVNEYWYANTAEVAVESSAATSTYSYFAWVNTTVDTLYGSDGKNTVRSNVDPLNTSGTAWSGQTVVGAAANSITFLGEKDGALLIDKEDMPYYLDSSGNVKKDLAPESISGKSTHSGKNSILWGGEYFRPTGDQSLLRVGTTNSWIQPSKFTNNNADYTGEVRAVVGDEEYLYTVLDNGSYLEILAGRDESIGGTTAWRWHPYQQVTFASCDAAWISTVGEKRLYIGSTAEVYLTYIPLPTKYGDIINDDNANFKTGGTFETKFLHGDFPSTDKGWLDLVLTMGHTYNANDYWTVKYKELAATAWTTIGNYAGSTTSMIQSRYLAGAATTRTSPMMKLQFTGVTASTARTPVLLDYKLNSVLYADVKRVMHAKVKVSRNTADLLGLTAGKYYKLANSCLENCRDASWPITIKEYLTTAAGTTRYVRLLPLPESLSWREPVEKIKGKEPSLEYNLLMMETKLA